MRDMIIRLLDLATDEQLRKIYHFLRYALIS